MSESQIKHLANSASGDLEQEIADLTIALFDDAFDDLLKDAGFYGAPYLGSFDLVSRFSQRVGLDIYRSTSTYATEKMMRYLFQIWLFHESKKGIKFADMYMRMLFPAYTFPLEQLWQKKSEPYPEYLRTEDEIATGGGNLSDYFLTSRIRINVRQSDADNFSFEAMLKSVRTSIPARFVIDFVEVALLSDIGDSGVQVGGVIGHTVLHYNFGIMTL